MMYIRRGFIRQFDRTKRKKMYTFTGNRKTSRVTLQRERVTSVFAIHDKCFIVAVLIW